MKLPNVRLNCGGRTASLLSAQFEFLGELSAECFAVEAFGFGQKQKLLIAECAEKTRRVR
jgi:hypothetical protein